MTGFVEDMLMRQEGLEDQDIADINAALPKVQQLDQAIAAEWPKITPIVTTIAAEWPKITPIIAMAIPLVPLFLRIANKVIAKQRTMS